MRLGCCYSLHRGRLEGVNLEREIICGGGHELPYDYLVLACGAGHSYFGRPEWEEFAPGLKTLEQGTEIRRRILPAFERAENELDADEQNALLTFVVVGAGPTGVELAGAIRRWSRGGFPFGKPSPARNQFSLDDTGIRRHSARTKFENRP